MNILDEICRSILAVFGILFAYKVVYQFIGFFFKPKQSPATDLRYRYAFLIAARNEASVIAQLIESIKKQDYDGPTPEIFIVADNCNDKTAEIARAAGAIVYERFDKTRARKGFALEFLMKQIQRDYGIDHVDGYFVFDADNLLAVDYITEMNKCFAEGHEIITSYRNTKNFDTNMVSSAYGIHFYRSTMSLHRPRAILKTGTHLTGTGYLLHSSLLADGWLGHSLTEDAELTIQLATEGRQVAYCETAVFFDEQPTDLATACKQRLRWSKGHLQVFHHQSSRLIPALFKHRRFAIYDMLIQYFPYGLFTFLIGGIYPFLSFLWAVSQPGSYNFRPMYENLLIYIGSQALISVLTALMVLIRERKNVNCSLPKMVLYTLTFPWFDLFTLPLTVIALFRRVEWKTIPHKDQRRIGDIPE